jgi:hypothetical protein
MDLLEERRCELAQLLDRLPIGSVLKLQRGTQPFQIETSGHQARRQRQSRQPIELAPFQVRLVG